VPAVEVVIGNCLSVYLHGIVIKIWRLKNNGVTTLTFWGHATSSVTWPFD